ncbi:MAG: toxin-antitoxin system HicB family antitoxin [Egibacteraceae bacterium]
MDLYPQHLGEFMLGADQVEDRLRSCSGPLWRRACYRACMAQMTLRLPDGLAAELRSAAAVHGQSLNAWATALLRAAVDPDLAGTEAERLRERLSRAGLLASPSQRRAHRPDPTRGSPLPARPLARGGRWRTSSQRDEAERLR